MRKFGKQLLAGPYLVWIIGFIILPVFAVLYYALTNSAGSFTMENIAAIIHNNAHAYHTDNEKHNIF